MFWQYNLISGSCIETLLDKEDVTLKELLEEEDILQECKAQNKKLLNFLVQPEVLEEMVTLTIQEPTDEGDEKLRFRYANRACELLTFDLAQINDALVSDESLLLKLYSFLNTEQPLNPLLASFFSKTVGLLINKKTDVMHKFLKDKDFVTLLLKHLDTSAIMDLLLRFITIENTEMQSLIIEWLQEQKLIAKLISHIDIDYNEEYNCNAAHALCDIVKVSREHMALLQEKAEPNPLLQSIESVEMVSELLNHMFKDTTKESALVSGISLLLALLASKKISPLGFSLQMAEMQGDGAPSPFLSSLFRTAENTQVTDLDSERLSQGVCNVINALTPRLGDFHKLLLEPPVKPAMTLTFGILDPPLGNCRLEVSSLVHALLQTNNHLVNVKLAENKTVIILIDMFFKYCWNNFLHTQVEHIIEKIVSNPPTADEEENKVHPLLEQLLKEYNLITKILDCFEEDPSKSTPGTHRKGYMGHLTKIANHIANPPDSGGNAGFIKEKIEELSEEQQKKWADFVSEKLVKINQNNKVCAVSGLNTFASSNDEDSVDFRDVPFSKDTSVHLGFSEFQMHEMTSNFVDQFGFNDEEFGENDDSLIFSRNTANPGMQNFQPQDTNNARSAELFEEVCREKFNPGLWDEQRENTTNFSTSFRMRISSSQKSNSENSSDSDEESQVFETEESNVTISREEVKMDVDHHDAMFDAVPMEVAPTTANDPWKSSGAAESTSDEPQNWADFSNFATFDNPSSDQSGVASSMVAMETSDAFPANKAPVSETPVTFSANKPIVAEFSPTPPLEIKPDSSASLNCDVQLNNPLDKSPPPERSTE